MKLYQNMRFYRKQISMSEYTLARLIGVDVEKVRSWEKGSSRPGATDLHFIACALNIDDSVLTDPGPLPEVKPARVEIKHEHAAFDGGVLGQPEGIYGTTEKNHNQTGESARTAQNSIPQPVISSTSATETETKPAAAVPEVKKVPVYPPVFASDLKNKEDKEKKSGTYPAGPAGGQMGNTVWNGKPMQMKKNAQVVSTVCIVIAIIFLFAGFGTLAEEEPSPMMFIISVIAFIIGFKNNKENKNTEAMYKKTEYFIRENGIVVETSKTKLEIGFDKIKGVRIVNEEKDTGGGTIIFDIYGVQKITSVPKMDEATPAAIFYSVPKVREVFAVVNSAYKNYKDSFNH